MDADTNRGQLLQRTEGTFNETCPATNNGFSTVRMTKESLKHGNNLVVSNDIRSDRGVSDQYLVGVDVTGGVDFELSGLNFDSIIEAALDGTFGAPTTANGNTASVLDTSVQLYRSFAFERGLLDVGLYTYYSGCMFNTLNFTIPSNNIVTASGTIMGIKALPPAGSSLANPTATAVGTAPAFHSGPGINNIKLNNTAIGVGVREIKLNINNNLRKRPVVDALESRPFGRGELEITGSLQIYMANAAFMNYFLNNTALALSFVMGDGVDNSYLVTLPYIKCTDDDNGQVSGKNADVMEMFNFRAFVDPVTKRQIIVTRNAF